MFTTEKVPSYARKALDIIVRAGFDARFAGGCVRDTLLGVKPQDWDVATDATPDIVTEIFTANQITVIPTGLAHGTVSALIDDFLVEITTLRKDVKTDGRHAKVEFVSDWKQDALRRDFTINALYADHNCIIHDYVDGVSDLALGRLRFVGDAELRIKEDALRMMRALRFILNSKDGFNLILDYEALEIIEKHANLIKNISKERIWSELKKALIGLCNIVERDMTDETVPVSQRTDQFQANDYMSRVVGTLMRLIGISTDIEFTMRGSQIELKKIVNHWFRMKDKYLKINGKQRHPEMLMLALIMRFGTDKKYYTNFVYQAMALKLKMSAKKKMELCRFDSLFNIAPHTPSDVDMINGDFNRIVCDSLYLAHDLHEASIFINIRDDMPYTLPEDTLPFDVIAKDVMAEGARGSDISRWIEKLRFSWSRSKGRKTKTELIEEYKLGSKTERG